MEGGNGQSVHFPFGLTTGGREYAATVNAADSHMMEVQAVMNHSRHSGSGNVLAIVSFSGDFEEGRSCDGKRWQDLRIRLSSEKLRALGSSKINDMFEPRRQQRIRRRLGLIPPDIEYVLDFTPPSEGTELADLTATLWLPKMVKLWFLAGLYLPEKILDSGPLEFLQRPMGDKAPGAILALGHDDVCKNESCLVDLKQWRVDPQVPGIVDEDPFDPDPRYIPEWRKIDDYCRIRHRVAIMRVLRAINGEGLLLNSAARMWTVAQVAIHLEVPQIVVDPVTQWLSAPPNTKFIEICPERAFQLAHALKIPSVLIASFRILVSELAVDSLAATPSPRRRPVTWAQRVRDDYGDFPSDPVEYASRAFADRITGILEDLQSDQAFNCLGARISQWERLQDLRPLLETLPDASAGVPHPLKAGYRKLVDGLAVVFKRNVATALDDTFFGPHLTNLMAAQRKHYVAKRDTIPFNVLYHALNDKQKALTSLFWFRLKNTDSFGSFTESTYQGKQLWRIAKDFNFLLNVAISNGTIGINSLADKRKEDKDSTLFYDIIEDFDVAQFVEQVFYALRTLCDRVLDRGGHDSNVPFYLSDHLLLSLNESELNYLPIWADGLDDGSGGVFQEAIPPAEMGPSEPGPSYHTGHTIGTDASTGTMTDRDSTIAPSDLGIGQLDIYSEAGSTVRSMDAQQSATTGPARGRAVAVSDGHESDSFSTADNEYADAMFAQPAEHQVMGMSLARYVEETTSASGDGSQSGDDMTWSEMESATGAGLEAGSESCDGESEQSLAAAAAPTAAPASGAGGAGIPSANPSNVDGFGLDNEHDMIDFGDDDDDDTSTLDGSEFDLI